MYGMYRAITRNITARHFLSTLCEYIHVGARKCEQKSHMHPSANENKTTINTSRSIQNGRHIPDDIFKRIFVSENVWNAIIIALQFVHKGAINNIPEFVNIMNWRLIGD